MRYEFISNNVIKSALFSLVYLSYGIWINLCKDFTFRSNSNLLMKFSLYTLEKKIKTFLNIIKDKNTRIDPEIIWNVESTSKNLKGDSKKKKFFIIR